ncbi:MAG: histidine phosphatase family protein [Pseudomonadota bacterium]
MIYLVRHGEAAAAWGNHPDPGLSETGTVQASAAARRLIDLGATQAITSPMQRCRETAAPFEALTGHAARVEPAVSEIVTPDGIEDRVSWLMETMSGDWPASLIMWRRDVVDAVRTLPDQTVVFSHFIAINAVVSAITGSNKVIAFRPQNASITTLKRDGDELLVEGFGREGDSQVL